MKAEFLDFVDDILRASASSAPNWRTKSGNDGPAANNSLPPVLFSTPTLVYSKDERG